MKVALLPSTQWKNPVKGGGSEAEYAHLICRYLKPMLEARGATCMIFSAAETAAEWTRGRDANGLGALAAVEWGADFCLSVHSDAGYDYNSHNAALICFQEERTRNLATQVLFGYCALIGFTQRGIQKRTPGVNGVAVLRNPEAAGIPAVLLEVTWHDRDPDAEMLRTPAWRLKCARAIADNLAAIFKLSPHGEEEVDEMLRTSDKEALDHHFLDCWTSKYDLQYLHIQLRGRDAARVEIYATKDMLAKPDADGKYYKLLHTVNLVPSKENPNPYIKIPVGTLAVDAGYPDCAISVHATLPVVCAMREGTYE